MPNRLKWTLFVIGCISLIFASWVGCIRDEPTASVAKQDLHQPGSPVDGIELQTELIGGASSRAEAAEVSQLQADAEQEERWVVGVALLSSGAPIAGARFAFGMERLNPTNAPTILRDSLASSELGRSFGTDSEGRFRVAVPHSLKRAWIWQFSEPYLGQLSDPIDLDADPVQIVFPGSQLDFSVVDLEGVPCGGAEIRVSIASDQGDAAPDVELVTFSNSQGMAKLLTKRSGEASVIALTDAGLFRSDREIVYLSPAGSWVHKSLQLTKNDAFGAMRVEVLWSSGLPVESYVLELRNANSGERRARIDVQEVPLDGLITELPVGKFEVRLVDRFEESAALYDPDRVPTQFVELGPGMLPEIIFNVSGSSRAILDFSGMDRGLGSMKVEMRRVWENESDWVPIVELIELPLGEEVNVMLVAQPGLRYCAPPVQPGEVDFRVLSYVSGDVLFQTSATFVEGALVDIRF